MKNRSSGFTLIEMMVTIAVLGILAMVALPNFQAWVESSRMTAQANDFLTALHMARSEAVKRNAPVTVAAKDGGWADGWQVLDADGAVLRDFPALKGGGTLEGDDTITFQPNGQAIATTFELRSASGADPGRDIEIDLSGRASVSKP